MRYLLFKVIIAALFVCVLVFHASSLVPNCVDDSFISFRYAYNLAHGEGLVFNKAEKVEGFSNPLWTVFMALPIGIGVNPEQASFWMGLSFAVLAVMLIYLLSGILDFPKGAGIGSMLICVFNTGYIASSTNGLAGGMYSFFILLALYLSQRVFSKMGFLILGMVSGIMGWVRMEGMLIGLVIVLLFILSYRVGREKFGISGYWARIGLLFTGYIIPVFLIILCRYLYYGKFVPNSIAAKTGVLPLILHGERGRFISLVMAGVNSYAGKYIISSCILLFPFVPLGILGRNNARIGIAVVCIFTLTFGIAVLNGGDWMPHYRLLNPLFPLIALFGISGMLEFANKISYKLPLRNVSKAVILSVLIGGALLQAFDPGSMGKLNFRRKQNNVQDRIGLVLNRALEANEGGIFTEVLGRISYNCPSVYVWDMFGLTDPYLAEHGRWIPKMGRIDMGYSISKKPAVILSNWFPTCRRMMRIPFFRKSYIFVNSKALLKDNTYLFIEKNLVDSLGGVLKDCFDFSLVPPRNAMKIIAVNHYLKQGISPLEVRRNLSFFEKLSFYSQEYVNSIRD